MIKIRAWAALVVLLACGTASGQPAFLDLDQRIGPEPQSTTRRFPLVVREPQTKLYLDIKVTLTQGRVTLRLLDPNGTVVREDTTGKELTLQASVPTQEKGTYQLEVAANGAAGQWKARVHPLLPALALRLNVVSGLGMTLVVLASVLYWRTRSKARWRWFWVGAGVWTVGVGLKIAWALPLNQPILHALKWTVPPVAYLNSAALYIGLLTGVFEIGVTLVAGLIWRKLAANAQRAVAVGVGAGAFEALLLGLVGLAEAVLLVSGKTPDALVAQAIGMALVTPLVWLVSPVERLIAILCHTSSRTLVLLTIATGRWRYFWWGFALMTALDGVAAYFLLSGAVTTLSTWWIELTITPAALASVPNIHKGR